jgi:hypothetical protein
MLAASRMNGEPRQFPAYSDLGRLLRRGEIVTVCHEALAKEGTLDTRELALRVIRAKGLDEGDGVLGKTIAFRVMQALSIAAKRGRIGREGKRAGVVVWRSCGRTQFPVQVKPCVLDSFSK